MSDPLEKEFKWYLDNQDELVKKYNGKFIVIKNSKVIESYDERKEALEATLKNHKRGSFIIQKCSPGTKDHTHIYHSRVATTHL